MRCAVVLALLVCGVAAVLARPSAANTLQPEMPLNTVLLDASHFYSYMKDIVESRRAAANGDRLAAANRVSTADAASNDDEADSDESDESDESEDAEDEAEAEADAALMEERTRVTTRHSGAEAEAESDIAAAIALAATRSGVHAGAGSRTRATSGVALQKCMKLLNTWLGKCVFGPAMERP